MVRRIVCDKKVKDTREPWTYVIKDLNDEEIIGMFCEKELQKTNQPKFRIKEVIKRKSDKSEMERLRRVMNSSYNN